MFLVIAGRFLVQRRSGSGSRHAAQPAWDRPESAQEAALLQAALARPNDAAAQRALGEHYTAAGRPFEALWAYQRAQELVGRQPAAAHGSASRQQTDLLLAQVRALEAAGLRSRALALLTEGTARVPADPTLAERQAELQLRLGRPTAAAQTLERALTPPPATRVPGSPENRRERGASYPVPGSSSPSPGGFREEFSARLASSYVRGRAEWGLGGEGLLLLARALEAAGEDQGALVDYRRAVEANPGSEEARLRLGRLLARLGQTAEGRRELEEAHRLAPGDPEPCFALGMSFWPDVAAHPDRAGAWFSQATAASPEYRPAHLALGRMYASHRLWKPAAEQFAQVLAVDVKDPDALLGLAGVLEATGHRAEAHERRGAAYVQLGKLPQALAEYRAELALLPGNSEVAMLISQVLIQMQRNAEAANVIKAAAARRPRDAALEERLGELLLLSHTSRPARRICDAWLRADPQASRAYWLRGRIALGELELLPAVDDFERAARLAPSDPEIRFALGEALSRPTPRRDLSRSLGLLGRAVELAPHEPRYRYQLGLLLQQLGRPEAAQRQLLRALDLDPQLTAAYTGLVQLSGKLREPGVIALFAPVIRDQQEAKRVEPALRRRVYRSPADPSAYAALARCLAGRGDLKEARTQWEVVATLRPGDAEARREIARLTRILDVL